MSYIISMDLIKSLYSKYQSSIGTLKSMWESYCRRVVEVAEVISDREFNTVFKW